MMKPGWRLLRSGAPALPFMKVQKKDIQIPFLPKSGFEKQIGFFIRSGRA
jgi:hypothetical protein